MILRLYRFIRGKLKVVIFGDFVDRILNLCTYNGITIWGIRKKNDKITFYISVSDFKRLHKIIRGKGIRIKILKKQGIPFIVTRYKKRYGIVAASLTFFTLLYFLSGFVWNIQVSGCEETKEEEVIDACNKIGIFEGVRIDTIDAWDKRVELQLELDELSWAAINIEGCVLTVDVVEALTENQEDESPCNLVASSDGIIRKIESTAGDINIHVGDAVTKGSLLVSGVVELSNGNTHLVRAGGKVIAEVEENYSVTVPLKQKIAKQSGRSGVRYTLDFFTLKIPLYLGSINYETIKETERKKFEYEGAYLPISIYKTSYKEIVMKDIELSCTEATEIAKEMINNRFSTDKIIEIKETVKEDTNAVTVSVTVKILKDIAKAEKILINTTN